MSSSRSEAGRLSLDPAERERALGQFDKFLEQDDVILKNPLLTGFSGTGKTVLMEAFRSRAQRAKWAWAGAVLDASAGLTEERLATRLMTGLAAAASDWKVAAEQASEMGFPAESGEREIRATLDVFRNVYDATPGLASDKLEKVLILAGRWAREQGWRGIVLGCGETHALSDRERDGEFPMALLLSVFQSIQRIEVPVMLLLAGPPTLPLRMAESRTFAERMFRTIAPARRRGEAAARRRSAI